MKKIIGLIPSRLGSKRLPAKALLKINDYPLIVHVYKRALLSKKLSDERGLKIRVISMPSLELFEINCRN